LVEKRNKTCGDGMKYYSGDEIWELGFAINGILLDRNNYTLQLCCGWVSRLNF